MAVHATKYVGKTRDYWNCGKGNMASKHLAEDEAIRSAVREFRILPERPDAEPFTRKPLQQTPSFSQLSSQQPVAKLPRSKSTGTLMAL